MEMMNKGLVFALLATSPAARYRLAGYPDIQNYRISGKCKRPKSMKIMNKGPVFALLAASPAARYRMAGYPVIQNYRISGKFKCLRVSR